MRRSHYTLALVGICLGGFTIRLIHLLTVTSKIPIGGDALLFYYWGAVELARGHGFISVSTIAYNVPIASAPHPPGFIGLLAFFYKLGLHSPNQLALAMCIVGTITIAVMGVLLAKIVSRGTGLLAAILTAIYPGIWLNDTVLMSETLLLLGLALGLYGIYSYAKEPNFRWLFLASTGLLIATLVRAEIVVLLPLTLVPLVLYQTSPPLRTRILHLALAAVIPATSLGVWTVYNTKRFGQTVLLSTGFGSTALAGACNKTFFGPEIGSISIPCGSPVLTLRKPRTAQATAMGQRRYAAAQHYFDRHGDLPPATWNTKTRPTVRYVNEAAESALGTKLWIRYSKRHKDRLPRVLLAREARITGLWNPQQQNMIDQFNGRGSLLIVRSTQVMFWLMCIFSIIGAAVWRRLRIPLYPIVLDIALTLVITGIVFALTRYRVASDLMLVPLAATGLMYSGRIIVAQIRRPQETVPSVTK